MFFKKDFMGAAVKWLAEINNKYANYFSWINVFSLFLYA